MFEVSDNESVMVTNGSNPQVQQKIDKIGQLRKDVDAVKAEAEEWKKNMELVNKKLLKEPEHY